VEDKMKDRVYNSGIEKLRSKERVERLEFERVVDLCLIDKNISSVLDVGTGSGLFAEEFFKRGIKIAGIDSSSEMINAAKDYLPDCELKVSEAENIPFNDNSFDLVFFGLVFHEVDNFKKVLSEAKRVSSSQVAILEWNYKTEEFGPPIEHRLSEKFMKDLSLEMGFIKMNTTHLKSLVLYKFYQ
jgi:ubiquinone/menaquinone biosynthesis C-methylase UbiE